MISEFSWSPVARQRNKILREYEPFQPYFFSELSAWRGSKCFIDVGANVGSYCFLLSQQEHVEHIHALEPTPGTFRELQANVVLNKLQNRIHCHQVAASSTAGTSSFSVFGDYSGANGLQDTQIHASAAGLQTIEVSTAPLDAFFNGGVEWRGAPIAIKIDVEGHETSVLEGAKALIGSQDALLQIESYSQAGGGARPPVSSLLEELGYIPFWRIGADTYYARRDTVPAPDQILAVVQRALDTMIADFRALSAQEGSLQPTPPITRTVFGDVALSVNGRSADWLRSVLKRLRARRAAPRGS